MPYLLYPDETEKLAQIIGRTQGSHRYRVLSTLEELPDVAESVPGPKFVYAHIIFPHPPYIVNANGNRLKSNPQNELTAYGEQIAYLDSRLTEIVDTLLEKSNPKPIIIIQSDHGASIDYEELKIDKSNRLGILNAYYLPRNPSGGNPAAQLYSTITPVNTFRMIFNQYFNGNYGLLEDKSIIGSQSPFTTLECSFAE